MKHGRLLSPVGTLQAINELLNPRTVQGSLLSATPHNRISESIIKQQQSQQDFYSIFTPLEQI